MDLCDKLIKLRISLATMCDGFVENRGCKGVVLSTRLKLLSLLNERDMSAGELIHELSIAKSNLANLSKFLVKEGVIEGYKNSDNLRNVYYRITNKGIDELHRYKEALQCEISNKAQYNLQEIEMVVDQLMPLIKGNKYD